MRLALACALCVALAAPGLARADYSQRPDVRSFIARLVENHGFAESDLTKLFSSVTRTEPVLRAIKPPPERPTWKDYRALFLTEQRIEGGVAFWSAHRGVLERASREYGVPAEVIVAIVGIETFYGRHTGRWRVLDALTTLAFDYPPRAQFFRSELEHYLLLARDSGLDATSVRGSYAGAMGIPQFMPGSTRHYAVDFDGDGEIDLIGNPADAIGSVANFLKRHGWQPGADVQLEARVSGEAWRDFADGGVEPRHALADLLQAGVKLPAAAEQPGSTRVVLIDLGTEHRLGLRNFYVLTRYNRSSLYAAAVADLAQALRERAQRPGR
jgi:membrane-bound lytic murein transglycosylase B